MAYNHLTARCGCGAIVRLPNLKARASSAQCEKCARGHAIVGPVQILDLVEVDRRELQPVDWYTNPLEAKFGQLLVAHTLLCFLEKLCGRPWKHAVSIQRQRWQARKAQNRAKRTARYASLARADVRRMAAECSGSLRAIENEVECVPGVHSAAVEEVGVAEVEIRAVLHPWACKGELDAAIARALPVGVAYRVTVQDYLAALHAAAPGDTVAATRGHSIDSHTSSFIARSDVRKGDLLSVVVAHV